MNSLEIYKQFIEGTMPFEIARRWGLSRQEFNHHVRVGRERYFDEYYGSRKTMTPMRHHEHQPFAIEGGAHYIVIGKDVYHHYSSPILRFYCRVSNWERSAAYRRCGVSIPS